MNFKKIIATVAAAAVAVSAMAVSAFAIKDYPDGYTLDLIAEGYNVTDVYGFTFNLSGDIDSGVGGGVGFNSASTGWESHEWGNADAGKELNASSGTVTLMKDAPVFQESDVTDPSNPYAQIWMQQWWGSDVTIDSVDVLGADGVVLTATVVEAADETEGTDEAEVTADTDAVAEDETADEVDDVAVDVEDDADEVTADDADDAVEVSADDTVAVDTAETTTVAATGNVAAASIVAVMAVAGVAAVATKKRK